MNQGLTELPSMFKDSKAAVFTKSRRRNRELFKGYNMSISKGEATLDATTMF